MRLENKFICGLFSLIWRRRLWNCFFRSYNKVVEVRGWRSALVQTESTARYHTTFLFWWDTYADKSTY